MLIVFLILTLLLIGGGVLLTCLTSKYDRYGDWDVLCVSGVFITVIGVIAAIAVIITICVQMSNLVDISVIDEKIAMYEEENAIIESQIETAVKQYQEYEGGIITEIGSKESYITLVSLYPELKADELVNKQIEVYMANNRKIIELKDQKINESVYRWWLYFG